MRNCTKLVQTRKEGNQKLRAEDTKILIQFYDKDLIIAGFQHTATKMHGFIQHKERFFLPFHPIATRIFLSEC